MFVFAALNGFLFGNMPEPEMCVGESVSWHLFGMGNEIDIHSIYFYGNTFITRGHRADVVNLFPATFLTTEMIVENPGKWMITCQVSDHLQGKLNGGWCGGARDGFYCPRLPTQDWVLPWSQDLLSRFPYAPHLLDYLASAKHSVYLASSLYIYYDVLKINLKP